MPDEPVSVFEDPHWPRASAWLAGMGFEGALASLAVLGVPLNCSITPGHCDEAPAATREALWRYSVADLEHHVDLRSIRADDLGDVDCGDLRPEDALAPISERVRRGLEGRDAVVLLGGDNGITRPGVHGLGVPLPRCAVLTFDAHFDLRDTSRGLHNGNPIRALLADGLPGDHISQIGLQSFANSPAYAEVAVQANITFHTVDHVRDVGVLKLVEAELVRLGHLADAIYVDLDLDVLDRAFSPGTPGSRPGGLTPQEMRRAAYLCGMNSKVRVMDLVELDPHFDTNQVTALAAASFLLSFAAGLATRHPARTP